MEKIKIHILLVEDSPSDAKLLREIFVRAIRPACQMAHVDRLNAAIDACMAKATCMCGDSSLPTLNEHGIDLVLLDLRLPDSTGLDTLKKFRAAVPDIPVVVLTGIDDEETALQAVAEGAQDYLFKNEITNQSLLRAIRYAIERGEILKQLRESEQRTREALLKEKELNELKSNFVAMVSHEFRNPMTTIRTSIDLLLYNNDKLTEERRATYFERMENAIKHMLQLLDEVLFLSKNEAGKFEYKPAPLNLVNFCRQVAESAQYSSDKQHTITFTSSGECLQVEMDEELLSCIFINLLSNAIKYSPPESNVNFELLCQEGMATFKIKDRGIGIPSKDQCHLFETFYRGSNVGKVQGTGLGLAIVKKCVELHRGQIQVESEVGVGTTVIVKLPLNRV
ncbi:ATP-binding response regulator [Fischerella sp. PCC 9605]|uniref:ATP-binding response regulator n=1 Tax=Fischerella sp. PCC 9605 TaxID=1173024 RepID=UPI00047A1BE9|nr:ATP-binding protein [Fischerella sp. PCC 9605]